jgi:hypothetical protein
MCKRRGKMRVKIFIIGAAFLTLFLFSATEADARSFIKGWHASQCGVVKYGARTGYGVYYKPKRVYRPAYPARTSGWRYYPKRTVCKRGYYRPYPVYRGCYSKGYIGFYSPGLSFSFTLR